MRSLRYCAGVGLRNLCLGATCRSVSIDFAPSVDVSPLPATDSAQSARGCAACSERPAFSTLLVCPTRLPHLPPRFLSPLAMETIRSGAGRGAVDSAGRSLPLFCLMLFYASCLRWIVCLPSSCFFFFFVACTSPHQPSPPHTPQSPSSP